MDRLTFAAFLKDRWMYAATVLVVAALAALLFALEELRYPGLVDSATAWYMLALALFVLVVWLIADYLRQRHYYRQLGEALRRCDDLQASSILHAGVTREQRLIAHLLQEQHRAYLNELNRYRRQQEQHNHFVLQWVHYMKTPVAVIDLQMQEALRGGPLGEAEQRELALSAQEEADRLLRGLELMLHTARLDKFALDLHIRQVALHELIRSSVNAHKRLCIKHTIYPRIEGEAWVETDEKWMTFVLNQLISNGIKYSKRKPGAKTLLFRITDRGQGQSLLEVIDEGIGIAPHDVPRIFDPFFTGENGRASGESTGMGLYLAKEVCGRLGHKLTVESELGVGTSFGIEFRPQGIHMLE